MREVYARASLKIAETWIKIKINCKILYFCQPGWQRCCCPRGWQPSTCSKTWPWDPVQSWIRCWQKSQGFPWRSYQKVEQSWKCTFLTKWFDPLDLSNQKKLLDLGYVYPRGVRGGVALFFFWKSVFLKHPNVPVYIVMGIVIRLWAWACAWLFLWSQKIIT